MCLIWCLTCTLLWLSRKSKTRPQNCTQCCGYLHPCGTPTIKPSTQQNGKISHLHKQKTLTIQFFKVFKPTLPLLSNVYKHHNRVFVLKCSSHILTRNKCSEEILNNDSSKRLIIQLILIHFMKWTATRSDGVLLLRLWALDPAFRVHLTSKEGNTKKEIHLMGNFMQQDCKGCQKANLSEKK